MVAAVEDGLELTLANHRRLRLFGVEAPRAASFDNAAEARARESLGAWLIGRRVAYEALGPAPDRWGRMAALVIPREAPEGTAGLAVAPALIDAGLARARVEPGGQACLTRLLALETGARADHRGLWAEPAYAVVAASDRAILAARAGEIAIVEGTVLNVGRTAGRLYLNFGPIRGVDFAATVATKTARTFEAAGMAVDKLAGSMVRLRGLLDARFGPQIELFDPQALEIVSRGRVSPQSGPLARQ